MSPNISWRASTSADIPRIIELLNAANSVDDPKRLVNRDDVEKYLASSDPTRNTVLALAPRKKLLGFGAVLEPESTPLAQTIRAAGVVHPLARERGIGTQILKWQEQRAHALLSTAPGDPESPRWLTTQISDSAGPAQALLRDRGFVKKRTWLEMERPLASDLPKPQLPPRMHVTTPEHHSSETWMAYNDSFRDHWGSSPDTWEAWQRREARADYRPDLSFIAISQDRSGADEVAGLVITRVDESEFAARGGSFAYIHLLGVRRRWRGRGIASALLLHAMAAFQAAGFNHVELNVDAASPTGATRVYERLGFRAAHSHSTHVLEL